MKKVLLLLAFVSCAASVSAQRAMGHSTSFFSSERADQPITFGIRAGVNFAGISEDPIENNFSGKIGYNVGVSVDFPLLESFYMQSGLYFTTKGAKYEKSYADYNLKVTANPFYLQLPILASYRLNFSESTQLQVNVGPYFAVGLGGKFKDEEWDTYDYDYEEFNLFGNKDSLLKRGDVGLLIGAGVTFGKVYVGFDYGFSLMNLSKEPNYSIKNSNFSINVGYNF